MAELDLSAGSSVLKFTIFSSVADSMSKIGATHVDDDSVVFCARQGVVIGGMDAPDQQAH